MYFVLGIFGLLSLLFFLMLMNGLLILSGKPLILGLAYSSPVVPVWVGQFFAVDEYWGPSYGSDCH